MLGIDQVLSEADLAAQAHDHVGRDVGMVGETRQHALEDLMVGPLEGQSATPLVSDGEDAVNVGEILAPGAVAKSVRDVARRARRAIHRADDRDIIPGAHPAVGAEISSESADLDPARRISGCSVAYA